MAALLSQASVAHGQELLYKVRTVKPLQCTLECTIGKQCTCRPLLQAAVLTSVHHRLSAIACSARCALLS